MFALLPLFALLASLSGGFVPAAYAEPARGQPENIADPSLSDMDAAKYLHKFGYTDVQFDPVGGTHSDLASVELFTNAIKNFQSFARLPVTGELDPQTKMTMKLPRCGLRDDPPDPDLNFDASNSVVPPPPPPPSGRHGNAPTHNQHRGHQPNRHQRHKRYVSQGEKWKKSVVTWSVQDYTGSLPERDVDAALSKAFAAWQANSGLSFARVQGGEKADIVIRFSRKSHGDNDPFDGPGGVLAHAYYPVYGGATHFDNDEKWGVTLESSYEGRKSLVQVAIHELGHALGLGHSDNQKAIMAPFYRSFQLNPVLDADDISGIQFLYGPPSSRTKPDRQPAPSSGGGEAGFDICREKFSRNKLDAITMTKDSSVYAFSGRYYWRIGDAGIDRGYPRLISQDWQGLPDNLDSAVTWREEGRTYFFKGDQYWRFTNMRAEPGYPRDMRMGFPGIPTPIDAAFVWSGNGKLYFVKGRQYWQFITDGGENENPIPPGYPKSTSIWHGVPQPIEAAFEWRNRKTYFFSGSEYSAFEDKDFNVNEAKYPRDTLKYWFGCAEPTSTRFFSDFVDTGAGQSGALKEAPANAARPASSSLTNNQRQKGPSYAPVIGPHSQFNKPLVRTQHAALRFPSRRKQIQQKGLSDAMSATENPNRFKEAFVPKDRQAHVNTTLSGARRRT